MQRVLRVLTQEEVAREMKISQAAVARAERSALRKLRKNPEARILMRYVCEQSGPSALSVEPSILRKLGTSPDASFMSISGFAPNL
jgi:transcriptional regulator with XRE-family HTH domain